MAKSHPSIDGLEQHNGIKPAQGWLYMAVLAGLDWGARAPVDAALVSRGVAPAMEFHMTQCVDRARRRIWQPRRHQPGSVIVS